MSMFTIHQRELLKKRLSYAICWAQVPDSYHDGAIRLAIVVLDELERTGFSAAAGRRAVEKVVASLEERAS